MNGSKPLPDLNNTDNMTASREQFLTNIRQLRNTAMLVQIHDYNHSETLFISDDLARMLEDTPYECLNLVRKSGLLHLVHPSSMSVVQSIINRLYVDMNNTEFTIQINTIKGHTIWCNVHAAFVNNFGEHYIYCTFNDITLLKEYEERLRNVYNNVSNNFYQDNVNALGNFRINLSRDTIEYIKGLDLYDTDVMNIQYSELLEKRSHYFPHTAEREEFLRLFSIEHMTGVYMEGERDIKQLIYSRRKDGRFCYVEYTATLTRHPLTNHIIAFIAEHECNNTKVSALLLDKILSRQFDMVSYLSDGYYEVVIGDPATIEHGSIFPLTRTGMYEKYIREQVIPVLTGTPEEKEYAASALTLSNIGEQLLKHEPYYVNIAIEIDGEIYYKRFDYYIVDPETNFYIVLKSDTTETHRQQLTLNEQLRTALEEARHANAAKTSFLSSMSHEIRTPMNAIIGLDNIALKDPDLPSHTREQLEKINGSAKHLLGLINDILDMSRIESGNMTLKHEEFSFSYFLEQINTIINGQCQDKGLEYEYKITGDVDDYYIGDDMKLKQVIINILSNSVKFTTAPGKVIFTISQTARYDDKATLRFTMKDTGIGMDADYIPRIFDAFSQEDSTTTNRYGGSGLGMAITKNLVEMMNGSITVDSVKNEGSTFTVIVTLNTTSHPDIAGQANDSTSDDSDDNSILKGLHVLIAEDVEINAEILISLLEMENITSEHAPNGNVVVDMFKASPVNRYDAILMDVRMPVLDGLGAAKAIRALDRPDAAVIPIIAMTANAFDEDVQRSLQAGMNAHLSKPVEPDILYDTLTELVGRRRRNSD